MRLLTLALFLSAAHAQSISPQYPGGSISTDWTTDADFGSIVDGQTAPCALNASCSLTEDQTTWHPRTVTGMVSRTATGFHVSASGDIKSLATWNNTSHGAASMSGTLQVFKGASTATQFIVTGRAAISLGYSSSKYPGGIPFNGPGASASFSSLCPAGGFGESVPSTQGGSITGKADGVSCLLSPDASGLIEQVSFNASASASAVAAAPQEGNFSIDYTLDVRPRGNVLQMVGGPSSGWEGTTFAQPFVVKVADNYTGDAVAGQEIVFQLKDSAGGTVGSVPTATAMTQADGTASANFTAPGPGTYTVEASCSGCVEGNPQVFNVTVNAIQTYVELVPGAESGNGQREKVGTTLPIPLRVRVRDTTGATRAGFTIEFSATDPNRAAMANAFSDPTPVTGADGVATTQMTLGQVIGDYDVLAHCPNCTGTSAGFAVAATGSGGTMGSNVHLTETASATPPGPKTDDADASDTDPSGCHAWITSESVLERSAPKPGSAPVICVQRSTILRCIAQTDDDISLSCTGWSATNGAILDQLNSNDAPIVEPGVNAV